MNDTSLLSGWRWRILALIATLILVFALVYTVAALMNTLNRGIAV